ncbi:MAG TPA: DUF3379 family protein [Pelomicrobium sp.]|nr:DUF3379 family protein [Pelomicrobium sp.]
MDASELNCLDARRALSGDPRQLAPAVAEHVAACPRCADYRAELLAQDERLAAALRVPVPDGLADRVLLRHGLARSRAPRWLALAATLVVALGVGGFLGFERWQQAPALEAIAHVLEDEPHELAIGRSGDVSVLAPVLAAAGIDLGGEGIAVRYTGVCPFRGGYAHHVVLETPFGKATLLVSPDKPLNSTVIADREGLAALAAPAKQGSFSLVAESREALRRIAGMVQQ